MVYTEDPIYLSMINIKIELNILTKFTTYKKYIHFSIVGCDLNSINP